MSNSDTESYQPLLGDNNNQNQTDASKVDNSTEKRYCGCTGGRFILYPVLIFLLIALIVIGCLVPFMIQKPSIKVKSAVPTCASTPLTCSGAGGMSVNVILNVQNPNIEDVHGSGIMYVYDAARTTLYGTGTIAGSTLVASSTTALPVTVVFSAKAAGPVIVQYAGGSQINAYANGTMIMTPFGIDINVPIDTPVTIQSWKTYVAQTTSNNAVVTALRKLVTVAPTNSASPSSSSSAASVSVFLDEIVAPKPVSATKSKTKKL